MNIIFLGHREIALAAFKKLLSDTNLHIKFLVIHSDRFCGDCLSYLSGIKKVAEDYNVKISQPQKTVSIKSEIKEARPDLIVSVGYMGLLPKEIFSVPKYGSINIHVAKLPKYRGRAPICWALINGEKEIGITVHYINEGIDSGDIIYQDVFPITDENNARTLYEKSIRLCPEVLYKAILMFKNGQVKGIPQNEEEAVYYPNLPPEIGKIDWNKSSREIFNLIRALVKPYCGAYTFYKKKKIFVWKSRLLEGPNFIGLPGHILEKNGRGVIVKTGDSMMLMQMVQEIGSEPIKASEYPFRKGDVLGISSE